MLPPDGYAAPRLFRGDAFGGWQMDLKQAGTAGMSPVGPREPDCPETMAWLWAELLGTADRGSCRSEAVGSWRGPCQPHGPSHPRGSALKGLLCQVVPLLRPGLKLVAYLRPCNKPLFLTVVLCTGFL